MAPPLNEVLPWNVFDFLQLSHMQMKVLFYHLCTDLLLLHGAGC